MDLRDLRLLLDVVEEGSVHSAARKLRLPRSTLRRRLENLEADVGSPLLVRGVAGVALTPAGAVVVEEGRLLLERGQRMRARAAASEGRAAGRVRVFVPIGMKREFRLAVSAGLRAVNPDLCVVERECEDPLRLLHEPFDFMIYFGASVPEGDWYSRVIIRAPLRLLASPGYLSRAGAPQTPSELAAHPVAVWSGAGHEPDVLPLLDGGTLPVRPWFVSNNLEMAMDSVLAGMGIAMGPIFGDMRGLVPVLEHVVGTEQIVRALSPHASSRDARVRAVQENINRFVASLPEL